LPEVPVQSGLNTFRRALPSWKIPWTPGDYQLSNMWRNQNLREFQGPLRVTTKSWQRCRLVAMACDLAIVRRSGGCNRWKTTGRSQSRRAGAGIVARISGARRPSGGRQRRSPRPPRSRYHETIAVCRRAQRGRGGPDDRSGLRRFVQQMLWVYHDHLYPAVQRLQSRLLRSAGV
jgi:hypothetical protein